MASKASAAPISAMAAISTRSFPATGPTRNILKDGGRLFTPLFSSFLYYPAVCICTRAIW